MADTNQVIRKNDQLGLAWTIDHYVPKTFISLRVDKDPGAGFGTSALKPAPDANTDANGAGSFTCAMPKPGKFTFTLTVKRPQGDEVQKHFVEVQELTYKVFKAPPRLELGKPATVEWEIAPAGGCTFKLATTTPDGKTAETKLAVDAQGKGSLAVTPKVAGLHKLRILSDDPHLASGTSPASDELELDVQAATALTLKLEATAEGGFPLKLDKDQHPTVRRKKAFQVRWEVKSNLDLQVVKEVKLLDVGPAQEAQLHFDPASNLARGDQPTTLDLAGDKDEVRKLALVCLDAQGKELARKEVTLLVVANLEPFRQEMIDLVELWMPTSLDKPRKGGKPLTGTERDLLQESGWNKKRGTDSKADSDTNKTRLEDWEKAKVKAKAEGKAEPPKPALIAIVTSCGDVLATLLRFWGAEWIGAFNIRDSDNHDRKPGAKGKGFYIEATGKNMPEKGDIVVLRDGVGKDAHGVGHVGVFIEANDTVWRTADGGGGTLPDQTADVTSRTVRFDAQHIAILKSPTDGKEKQLDGWVALDRLPRKAKP